NDRVAIMVFDRTTRLRLPFRNSREDVERGLELLLRQETFDGGTDITRGLLDAAQYVGREGRRDARRAVVILTDDQTGGQRDEAAVSRALVRAESVLSALIAPDAMQGRYGQQGGGYPRRRGSGYPGGSSWPGGGGLGGTLGGIILGRGGPYGGSGGGMPGPVVIGGGPRMQSAGTSEIARQSGGDSMPVEDASALETTLSRIRQRYALHYYLPEGDRPGEQRNLQVDLADSARRRYRDAEVRFRQVYMAGGTDAGSPGSAAPVVVTRAPANIPSRPDTDSSADPDRPRLRRRPASNEPDGSRPSITTADRAGTSTAQAPVESTAKPNGGWRRVDEPAGAAGPAATPAPPAPDQEPRSGGWRKLKPGEKP
ncbi:MAG TPA: vWA domain-containing protein, partial [Bryobacteraceae bacterium]|nr:vWA domain-containing protein [Bryobacteraceae bacterium]